MRHVDPNSDLQGQMREWRRDFHAHPEIAYLEQRTSAKVAQLLESFGLEVHRGLAHTGVVATLRGSVEGTRAIGLRADLDALPMQELNECEHRSRHPQRMHGCGHDGHIAMLLGAAAYLSKRKEFAGLVRFIFQPAEEGEAGGRKMCEDGLFEQFPVDAVYGMHNWPGLEEGCFAVHAGPVMACMDLFDIVVHGKGGHAGMPHLGVDSVAAAAQLITSLQSVVARGIDPADSGVLSITRVQGGNAYNVLPESVSLSGTCRAFTDGVRDEMQRQLRRHAQHICAAYGAEAEISYRQVYPATVNDPLHAAQCARAAQNLVGAERVKRSEPPSMGAEDFAFMLLERPGAYIWIGNGMSGHGLHSPHYDFNDRILSLGASYWVELVHILLARGAHA